MKKVLLLFFSFSIAISVYGQNVDFSGTSAANFLKIGVGARITAMGDAAIASVSDATAMYWNVGAITRAEGNGSIAISSQDWLVDTRLSYIAAVMHFGSFGSLGLDLAYLDYGKIEETTIYDQDGTGRYFESNDVAIGLGYARSLTHNFSVGVKVKYISETLANVTASAFGFDVGAVFRTTFFNNNMRLAASLSNFGSKMRFEGRDLSVIYSIPDSPSNKQVPADLTTINWEIPLLFRFGISNYFVNNEDFTMLLGYDVLDSRDYEVRHNVGTELGYRNTFFVRGGYKFNYDEVDYSFGLGFNFADMLGYPVKLDYVYLNYGVFDALNQFTFSVNL